MGQSCFRSYGDYLNPKVQTLLPMRIRDLPESAISLAEDAIAEATVGKQRSATKPNSTSYRDHGQ